jgi:hypothetical protein
MESERGQRKTDAHEGKTGAGMPKTVVRISHPRDRRLETTYFNNTISFVRAAIGAARVV